MNELRTLDPNIIASLVINGDMKRLPPEQKIAYYNYRCQQAGLDPAAKPFDLLTLNGKEILYANASCTQQLCAIHKLSHQVTSRELVDDIYCVFVRVVSPDGRSTENMGAVPVKGLVGEAKANAFLKATTKGIRRSVLAHTGLGMMDETEVETIPGAARIDLPAIVHHKETPQAEDAEEEWDAVSRETMEDLLGQGIDLLKKLGKDKATIAKWEQRYRGQKGDGDSPSKVFARIGESLMKMEQAYAQPIERPIDEAPEPDAAAGFDDEAPEPDLEAQVSANWLKLRKQWKDEEKLNEIHLQNRIKARLKGWTGEIEPGSEEWLEAILAGQEAEMEKAHAE